MGRARAEIFHKHIVQRGGRVRSQPSPEVTHIIVNEGMDGGRALRLLRLAALPPSVRLVTAAWLSTCISERKLLSTAGYDVSVPDRYVTPGWFPRVSGWISSALRSQIK